MDFPHEFCKLFICERSKTVAIMGMDQLFDKFKVHLRKPTRAARPVLVTQKLKFDWSFMSGKNLHFLLPELVLVVFLANWKMRNEEKKKEKMKVTFRVGRSQ